MIHAARKGTAVEPERLRLLRRAIAPVVVLLVFSPVAADSDWADAIMAAFNQPGATLDERLGAGFSVYGDAECEDAAWDLQQTLTAAGRQERLNKVSKCLTIVRSTLIAELARRRPDKAIAIIDAVLAPLKADLELASADVSTRLALAEITAPRSTLYQRLENGFRANGQQDCESVANDLQGKLKVSERKTKLREVTECLALLRSNAARSLTPVDGSREAVATVEAALDASKAQLTSRTETNNADNRFLGQTWGVGFGASYAFDRIIEDAVIVDGLVRVTEDLTLQPRIILETHNYFFGKKFINDEQGVQVVRAWGLFGAVVSGGNDVLAGVGGGVMVGWKAKDPTKGSGFSLGLGVILDGRVKTLGEGFEENKPPPGTETAVRYETKARPSGILFFTRTF